MLWPKSEAISAKKQSKQCLVSLRHLRQLSGLFSNLGPLPELRNLVPLSLMGGEQSSDGHWMKLMYADEQFIDRSNFAVTVQHLDGRSSSGLQRYADAAAQQDVLVKKRCVVSDVNQVVKPPPPLQPTPVGRRRQAGRRHRLHPAHAPVRMRATTPAGAHPKSVITPVRMRRRPEPTSALLGRLRPAIARTCRKAVALRPTPTCAPLWPSYFSTDSMTDSDCHVCMFRQQPRQEWLFWRYFWEMRIVSIQVF